MNGRKDRTASTGKAAARLPDKSIIAFSMESDCSEFKLNAS
jgi:hypothetical protein